MLIIPIQNRPDWSRPPLITLGLIVINLLVFILYQGGDADTVERATEIYHQHQLLEFEGDYYKRYLAEEDPSALADLRKAEEAPLRDEYLFWNIFYDREFDHYLEQLWPTLPTTSDVTRWRNGRRAFERERNQLSSIEAGLTPAQAKPWTFVTSLFLHGGWDHLLGNMAFLFLFGFTLEGALRWYLYLAMYLLSGIAASGLFVAFNLNSQTPLVGASGAISGLMGMYLVLYRLRKIRFFYTVLFYFGELRAPALVVLPLWLGKELYGHFFVDSNTAYWAHVGGLLAGAGLMLLAPKSQQAFDEAEREKSQEDALVESLKRVQQSVVSLNLDAARALARSLVHQFPEDPRPWQALFDLAKLQPKQKAFHQTAFEALKAFVHPQADFAAWRPQMESMVTEYQRLSPQAPALNGKICLALARKYWQGGALHLCEDYLRLAREKGVGSDSLTGVLNEIHQYYRRQRQTDNAARFAHLLRQLS